MRRLEDGTPIMEFKTEEDVSCAISYFGTLREFLNELKEAYTLSGNEELHDIFEKYRIQFMDGIDEIPRVGIENPRWRVDREKANG